LKKKRISKEGEKEKEKGKIFFEKKFNDQATSVSPKKLDSYFLGFWGSSFLDLGALGQKVGGWGLGVGSRLRRQLY